MTPFVFGKHTPDKIHYFNYDPKSKKMVQSMRSNWNITNFNLRLIWNTSKGPFELVRTRVRHTVFQQNKFLQKGSKLGATVKFMVFQLGCMDCISKIILARCWESYRHNCAVRNDSDRSNHTILKISWQSCDLIGHYHFWRHSYDGSILSNAQVQSSILTKKKGRLEIQVGSWVKFYSS